ncbi:Bromodomain and WD repeat-containing protein 1 [Glycine max]|nr:Bromodomain and WD repeat-containing protein 1 [Glycine max]
MATQKCNPPPFSCCNLNRFRGCFQNMDSRKGKASVSASSLSAAPLSVSNKVDQMVSPPRDVRAVETDVDIDLREIYFLIMHFLSVGPCHRTFLNFKEELLEHQLLPRRYHAWFSRSGEPSGDDADEDDDGISLPLDYSNLVGRYPHITKDHLVKLLKQLMLSTVNPLHGKLEGSSPNAADVPTLLGYGSFSLLNVDRKTADKLVKPPPLYMRWPHMKANQVQGLSLREIGGGFTKHHRSPSIRSACYAIAKPSTMVQKMQNIKKLRGHRVAVYCAIFDGSGRYVISGSDDRLVKIWSMETAFCLASCRGHEGDITDLAVSSNNALVASASNDFVIRVWRLPDGMPISVLRGHTGAVNTITFSPSVIYQLLSSSDDGTCRIWDARNSHNPRIYVPRPPDAINGKGNAPPASLPSSSNVQQSYQVLCCAYNANGTVFVTGSSDTYARVWSALKPNTDDAEQPIHEMDLLSGHENDVNYVQFSGCSVASKILTSDPWKEENTLKFRNFWYCHDNIVTCSRDGSAIIWVPRSRKSHGKVGRWTRAYHLKVPPPPLPPQPPRGGPRQRFLPTPRGVNMIIWSLDNRFVLAAIMDCRICVWNAVDGSLVHSLTGHTESSYVLDVHPFNPRIAMSAGYDGRTIVWDIWEGIPIRTYEIGRFKLVDGKFSPDGTSIVLSDDVGQIYFLNTGQGESQKDAKYDQFFLGDYRPLIQDTQGYVLDQETQLPPHRRNIQEPLCDSSMLPYPEPYQSQFQQRRLGALGIEWRPSLIKYAVGPDFTVGQDYPVVPLVDLEVMVEPQPEFLDAMFWEPEYDIIVSDDADSEYNANEDSSSAAGQGSVISSSDLEYSDDSSNRDGLRRSRRKKHNVGVEVMTSSGRRVRKRNLDECNGNTSGSNRLRKKSKGSSKASKRKSSIAKTLRPQRIAAHNARSMFSQIDETSTDGEDNDSDEEASDSFQDPDDLSESEREMDNKHLEIKKPLLEKFATVSKPPAFSESLVNVETRPRLVVKFSLRDSKKNVPTEDTRLACETQDNMVSQSSRPQPEESDQKTFPDTKSLDPALSSMVATNAELPQSLNGNENDDKEQTENATNNLYAFRYVEANTDQCRKMKTHTHELSRSGDALLTDAEIDDLLEHNANGRSEHVIGKLETVGSMVNTELTDFEDAPKFSSLEPSLFGNPQPNADGSLTSGYDKFNEGDKGQSGSDKCAEDTLENNEVVHSSHCHDLKMKAPVKSTKLVIKKKQISADTEGPCKLKIVSSKADSSCARGIGISENSSSMGPNLVTEVPEGEDDRKFSSPQLLHSYSDKRSYDHFHKRDKSYKGKVNQDGFESFDCDMGEHTSVFSNQHGLGIGLSDVTSDPMRQTRFIRMKTTSEEPSTSNRRIKIRQGQSSRGKSDREDSSTRMSDQLHRRIRTARHRNGEYIANDSGTLTRRVSNHHVKKLSWLMLSEPEEGYRYIPQLGDEVVYLRQGHQEYIKSYSLSESGPWRSFTGLGASEICKVEELEYAELPGSGDSCCKLKLRFLDPSSCVHGKSFKLTLPELINFTDFVIEKTWYDTAMKRNWSSRDKCMVWWRNEDGKGGSWWDGRIIQVQAKSDDFPESPWERYRVQYKTDPTENHLHSPWELYDSEMLWEHPHIDHEIRDKLLSYFTKLDRRERFDIQALNQVAEKLEFANRFPAPFYPELIQSRLKNDYYRSVEGVNHDIMIMLSNAEEYFKITKNVQLVGKIRRISEWFRRKLERI